ncbi:MAG TPA: Rv3654c family TadE-like protein [Actinomycetota bacterium]|nr:Rv3654c family TadE-like protein [Actinomycetota bacterium]
MRPASRDERGSVSIVVAAMVMTVVVLGLAGADLARVLTAAAEAQTAADAAALAAAQELFLPGELEPIDVAREYADRNGATLVDCRCERETLEAVVTVLAPIGPLVLFGDDRAVRATARAVVDLPA